MVTFIPSVDPAEIENQGERKVAEAFAEHLADNVRVIHSLNWVRKRTSGPLVEGECDFLVLDPANGLLFIEVKGGILGFDPDSGEWWRLLSHNNKVPLNKDPFSQVQSNMHAIVEHIRERLRSSDLSFTYGFAVFFPDGSFQGQAPIGITRQQILDATDLRQLSKRLRSIFSLFQRSLDKTLSRDRLREIERALFAKYDVVPVEWREVELQEKRLHRLTEEQKRLLGALANQTAASIQGGAGTGKTLLALAKAQQAAQSGMRTLLLCYNRPLRNWLNDTAQLDFEQKLKVHTYHELVHETCKSAGIEFDPASAENSRQFWNDQAPDLLMQACELLPDSQKFDAVVVDEGQDFQELWWHSLDSVFRDPDQKRCFYVFFDPNQNLYLRHEVQLPSELGAPILLEQNCRNSPEIAEYCSLVINNSLTRRNHSLEVFQVKSRETAFRKITDLVSRLSASGTGGLKPSQIAVLVPGYPVDDWPERFKRISATRDLDAWRNDQGILIESYARFKGLEADAVVILTAPLENSDDRIRRLNYVACSRAKHILKIVEVVEE